jgi:hypothetical protein
MSVVSQSNKQMLFDLLKSIGNDNNFVIDDNQLMNFITQKCGYFHANRFEFDFGNDLNEINKKIVEQGYNLIMSNQPRKAPQKTQTQQPQLSKREMFDAGLASQEEQFKKMINPKKPKEIDFSDGSEDFPMQNLDQIMNQTLADRQRELETITQKYSNSDKQKAQQWLNREEDTPRIKIEKSSNLKLDNTISISNTDKRVRFEVNEKPKKGLNNLFSKLKQKTPNSDIINKLDTIISNQEKILELLTSKKEKEILVDEVNLSAI